MEHTDRWSHVRFDRPGFPEISRLLIGAATDNSTPVPAPISGLKSWASEAYDVGIIYKNTTYNTGLYHYMEVPVNMD